MNFKGIVLAGGKSSRFGEDKALAKWRGKTLLEIAVNLLDGLCLDPVVIANPKRNYSFLTCPVVNDLIPEKGPLGGLYTACSLFPGIFLVVLTCDMPLLSDGALKELIRSHRNSDKVTVFSAKQALQPFPGIYSANLKTVIHDCLSLDQLNMKLFLSGVSNKRVLPEYFDSKIFQNVNRQEDLSLISDFEDAKPGFAKRELLTKN